MYKNDIYIGKIIKCLNFEEYKKKNLNTIEIVDEKAILVRTTHGYVQLNDIDGLFVNTKLRYELFGCILFNEPEQDGDLFVEEATMIPYYNNRLDGKINIKKLQNQLGLKKYN